MKKVLIISVLFAVLGAALIMQPIHGKTLPYYSGKAVNYNGMYYVGTTNTGDFELFALNNGSLDKVTDIQSNDKESKTFSDLLFQRADGNLYVYLVNGRYLYKYDITNPLAPEVLMKVKDNSWDWFSRVEMVNGNLVTIGSKGTKVWNKNMQVINSYNMITSLNAADAQFVDNGRMIASLKGNLNVYSTATNQKLSQYTIASAEPAATKSFVSDENLMYVVDDQNLSAVNFDGQVVAQYQHAGNSGYDVITSTDPNYLYFSDGVGVVKMDKESFQSVKWNWTIRTSPAGSWATGLASANDVNGDEKVAVFNGNEILVLDSNMNRVAEYTAVEKDSRPIEAMTLSVDRNFAATGSQIELRGTGFSANETVNITIAKIKVDEAQTDSAGRFDVIVSVPSVVAPLNTDIKVTGEASNLTYSTSFRIE